MVGGTVFRKLANRICLLVVVSPKVYLEKGQFYDGSNAEFSILKS